MNSVNNSSTDIIKRQLLSIQLLLEGNYVSTRQIQEHLLKSGIETKLRSLQRDLAALEEILPIECRKDDKPYSWRWQRLAATCEHQLSLSQAIALRLVETELRGVIPEDLYDRLQPLFMKSHFVTGLSQLTNLASTSVKSNTGVAALDDPKRSSHSSFNIIAQSPMQRLLMKLRIELERRKNQKVLKSNKTLDVSSLPSSLQVESTDYITLTESDVTDLEAIKKFLTKKELYSLTQLLDK